MKTRPLFLILGFFIISLSTVSALTVSSVYVDYFKPGSTGVVTIELKNNFDYDIKDVSVSIDLSNLPFTTVGSSEDSTSKLAEGKREQFIFTLKSSPTIRAGDYDIPFTIYYKDDKGETKFRKGNFGVAVEANPELIFTASTISPVIGQKGKIALKIINKGFADAKFVSVKISPNGFILLSDSDVYVGTVSSDDFETATFDVIFKSTDAALTGLVEYTDFKNTRRTSVVNIPIEVYTKDKGIELGLLKKSYIIYYFVIAFAVVFLWVLWRIIAKKRKIRRSMQNARQG